MTFVDDFERRTNEVTVETDVWSGRRPRGASSLPEFIRSGQHHNQPRYFRCRNSDEPRGADSDTGPNWCRYFSAGASYCPFRANNNTIAANISITNHLVAGALGRHSVRRSDPH